VAKTDQATVALAWLDFDEKFVRPAFDNIRPDWESGPDMVRYTFGAESISGGRPEEAPLFKTTYEWAAHRYKSSIP
jgi:hypothetical protein